MLKALGYLIVVICIGSVGHVVLAKGMQAVGPDLLAAFQNPWVLAGVGLEILYFVLWLKVLSLADVSWAVPMNALEYVFVALLAIFFLGETITWQRWLGTLFVCIGAVFMMVSWGEEVPSPA